MDNSTLTSTLIDLDNKPSLIKQAKKMIIVVNATSQEELSKYVETIGQFMADPSQQQLYLAKDIILSISYVDEVEIQSNLKNTGEQNELSKSNNIN